MEDKKDKVSILEAKLTAKAAEEAITEAGKKRKADFEANKTMLEGDFWQEGSGWRGALPLDPTGRAKALLKIKALFTSQNVMGEVLSRHVSGVVGKDPEWYFVPRRELPESEQPTDPEKATILEYETAMSEWWSNQKVHKTLVKHAINLLSGERSVLRIFIPAVHLGETGTIASGTLDEQLAKIRVQAIEPDKAAVREYVDDGLTIGYFKFVDDEDNDQIELTYVNEAGQTIIKIIGQEGEYIADIGGKLSMFESQRPLFLTNQIREQNGVINKAHTMLSGNLDSGFLERTFLNAQPPGKWETLEDGTEKFIPDPIQVGAGVTNFIAGIEYEEDADGKKRISNPSVVFREPIDATTFVDSKDHAYRSILEEARQKHALIAGDANPSGESRVQALGDFVESLNQTKAEIDGAGLWVIETVAAIASDLANMSAKFEALRGEFNSRLSPGPLPASLIKEIINQFEKGLLPREDTMAMLGVDDVDAAISRIDTGTEYAKEILDIMDRVNIKPPTLVKKLFKVIQADQDILSDLEETEKTAIETEIDEILNRSTQERDFFNI